MRVPKTQRSSGRRPLALALVVVIVLVSCQRTGRSEAPERPGGQNVNLPDLTAEQAGDVVSDAMLITSRALYLALDARSDSREVRSADGLLVLSWSEDADFLTGAGRYRIALDGYAIRSDDPFAEHYRGYVLSGTIELNSPAGLGTEVVFDLEADHADRERFPARRVELELGRPEAAGTETTASVRVNGRQFAFSDLDASF